MTAPTDPGSEPGHPASLLADLAGVVPVATIDELWIFPPRLVGAVESIVIVVSAFEGEDGRRRVLTARYTTRRGPKAGAALERLIAEHGVAPADRIGRLVEGVLRRLDEDLAALPPRPARIAGDPEAWATLLEQLAEPEAGATEAGATEAGATEAGPTHPPTRPSSGGAAGASTG